MPTKKATSAGPVKGSVQVNQLAKQADVTVDTVRYYTRIGLLHPTRDPHNSYKLYSSRDLDVLKFAVRAKQLGFALEDIKAICSMADHGETPCPKVREIMLDNLRRTETMFNEIKQLRDRMREAVKQWDHMNNCDPTGHMICALIENWDEQRE